MAARIQYAIDARLIQAPQYCKMGMAKGVTATRAHERCIRLHPFQQRMTGRRLTPVVAQ